MPNLWIASFNKGKLKEFESLFRETDFTVRSASEFKSYNPPAETGKTFLDNALIKAEAFRPMVNNDDWVIGEDSGIEVEALNNLPGIFSARYAGPKAMDSQNNDKLLKMLNFKQTDNRKARYFCQIVALGPNGKRIDISGTCEGEITTKPDGTGGFGYDPLFKPNGYDTTMANIGRKEKNKISHRAKASLELLKELSNLS